MKFDHARSMQFIICFDFTVVAIGSPTLILSAARVPWRRFNEHPARRQSAVYRDRCFRACAFRSFSTFALA